MLISSSSSVRSFQDEWRPQKTNRETNTDVYTLCYLTTQGYFFFGCRCVCYFSRSFFLLLFVCLFPPAMEEESLIYFYSFLTFIQWSYKQAIISRENKRWRNMLQHVYFQERNRLSSRILLLLLLFFVIWWLPIIDSKDRSIRQSNLDDLQRWTRA